MSDPWPADAKSDEKSCCASHANPGSELQELLVAAMLQLIQEMQTTNALMAALIEANQQMLAVLLADEDIDMASLDTDMEGNPIKVS